MQHGATPDHGGVTLREMSDGNHLDPVGLRRHDHVIHLMRAVIRTQHVGDRVAINISIKNADRQAALCQRCSQVHRHGGFAHTTFATGNCVHTRSAIRPCEGVFRLSYTAAQVGAKLRALFVAHDVGIDTDVLDASNRSHSLATPFDDGGLHRAARDRQIDSDSHR